ncbi:MAG: hypothetical protein NC350_04800 [Corallococcus sp.]|nr:hypothetical protein [Corallococcus sp.]
MNYNTSTKLTILLLITVFGLLAVLGFFPSSAFAESSEQYVKFDYLRRIPDTPFAEKVHTVIKVPVYEGRVIKLPDVMKALRCARFGVMQSYCDTFAYDAATDTYTAVYYKSVYLNAKTVDGNSVNYYLDCNLSFKDYYYEFVKNDIFDNELYEYYYNLLHTKYTNLNGYTADNIYGYWGVVVIPRGNNLNQLWADMFGSTTTYQGVLENFVYTRNLKYESYNKLLHDYQYNWLEIAWKTIVGFVSGSSYEANFYVIYCDSQTTEAFVAENGASDVDDNHGAIWNEIENGFNAIVDKVKTFFADNKVVGIVLGVAVLAATIAVAALAVKRLNKTQKKPERKRKGGR